MKGREGTGPSAQRGCPELHCMENHRARACLQCMEQRLRADTAVLATSCIERGLSAAD